MTSSLEDLTKLGHTRSEDITSTWLLTMTPSWKPVWLQLRKYLWKKCASCLDIVTQLSNLFFVSQWNMVWTANWYIHRIYRCSKLVPNSWEPKTAASGQNPRSTRDVHSFHWLLHLSCWHLWWQVIDRWLSLETQWMGARFLKLHYAPRLEEQDHQFH